MASPSAPASKENVTRMVINKYWCIFILDNAYFNLVTLEAGFNKGFLFRIFSMEQDFLIINSTIFIPNNTFDGIVSFVSNLGERIGKEIGAFVISKCIAEIP